MNADNPQHLHAKDARHVIHPHTHLCKQAASGPMMITRGDGIFIEDDCGNRYLEGAAGLWCASLGFSNRRLADVAHRAMCELGFYHIFRGASNPATAELCERLAAIAPAAMEHVLLQSSGSEANDAAIKLVWYYWNAMGQPQRRKLISRQQSYHGTGALTSCLTGKPVFHNGFGLPFDGFLYTAMPNTWRDLRPGESERAYSARLAAELEAMILREGPETIAAFWAEPVTGSGGVHIPPEGYFGAIQEVLDRHGILFVSDEVICGFGRTGEMWGCQSFGARPDLITCAKSLSAGMQPISAVIISDKIYAAMEAQSDRLGSFTHGNTYAGHPVAAAVALETLKIYEEMDLLGHVARVSAPFAEGFAALVDHPLVGESRSIGLLGALEIAADKVGKTSFPASAGVMAIYERAALRNGLITSQIGNRIALSPPQIITAEEIGEMFARLRRSLDETAAELA